MRRAVGTVEDLGDGRWRVRVTVGHDKTGKDFRPSRVIRGTRRDAELALSALVMQCGKLSPDKMTLEDYLLQMWLPTKQSRRRRTVDGYESKIKHCIAPYIGSLQLSAVTSYVIERWMTDLRRGGYSAQTVIHARSVMKNAMRAAVRWRLVDFDPTEGIELPEVEYIPAIITAEQMGEYVRAFRGHVIEPVVIIAIAAGFRRSEECALDWGDIDFQAGTVSVTKGIHQRGGDVWEEPPKSKSSRRTVALPPWAVERLKELRGVGPLVPYGSERMKPDTVSAHYRRHLQDSGLPYVPLRNLRNSHGTFLRESGMDLEGIKDQLGHSDTAVTRDHYVVRSSTRVESAAAPLLARIPVGENGRKVGEMSPSETQEMSPDMKQTARG